MINLALKKLRNDTLNADIRIYTISILGSKVRKIYFLILTCTCKYINQFNEDMYKCINKYVSCSTYLQNKCKTNSL